MNTRYQLVITGKENLFQNEVIETFIKRINDLGLNENSLSILKDDNFNEAYEGSSPTVCLYFGALNFLGDSAMLERLIADACYIIPVVPQLESFSEFVPKQLTGINGFLLNDNTRIEALVARVMECLSLLRISRRLFISYRRVESSSIAIQLYEFLDRIGFDVFLDTHSINAGDVFQEELWHRLVDTDVVVLLDTPEFLKSRWTEDELAKASSMSIGILQLVWPQHSQAAYSKLSFPFSLDKESFINGEFKSSSALLKDATLELIGSLVESIRARSISSRQDNLIQEFTSSCKALNKTTSLQPEKFLILTKSDGSEVAFIPTIGVPHGFTYNQTQDSIKAIKGEAFSDTYLLYDHRNIRDKWLTHLTWLDSYLPVKTMKITEINTELLKFK